MDLVILVDENDREIGSMEKMAAHRSACLHRAISVFIFNSRNELILQKRALHKYHSPGLWTNTCCSHPFPGESPAIAAHRRLQEEMGLSADLKYAFKFQYRSELDQGLTEHEIDHVFVGQTDAQPQINPDEVAEWEAVSLADLQKSLANEPEIYTAWFKIICHEHWEKIVGLYG